MSTAAENFKRLVMTRVHVSGHWRLFRECTHDDLSHLVERHLTAAASLEERAAWLLDAQIAMSESAAEIFDDLPAEIQMSLASYLSPTLDPDERDDFILADDFEIDDEA